MTIHNKQSVAWYRIALAIWVGGVALTNIASAINITNDSLARLFCRAESSVMLTSRDSGDWLCDGGSTWMGKKLNRCGRLAFSWWLREQIASGEVGLRVLPVVGIVHRLEPAYLRWLLGSFYWLKRASAVCRSV